MKTRFYILFFLLISMCILSNAQVTEHKDALEAIIVETYYVADEVDAEDEDGGELLEGSITYRIFVDMKTGYNLQAVFGDAYHEFKITTTGVFFNNEDRGEIFGTDFKASYLEDNTVILDSYLTLGAASEEHLAVPKHMDSDGSVVSESDYYSNDDPRIGLSIKSSDGMIEATINDITPTPGLDFSMFEMENSSDDFQTKNGAYAVPGGVKGADDSNIVLIAQITTNGDLTFNFNVQLGVDDYQGFETRFVQFVHDYQDVDSLHNLKPDVLNYVYSFDNLAIYRQFSVSSIDNPIFGENISLYPVPAKEYIQADLKQIHSYQTSYEIVDLSGKSFRSGTLNQAARIMISDLSPGFYLLKLSNGDQIHIQKFVKE